MGAWRRTATEIEFVAFEAQLVVLVSCKLRVRVRAYGAASGPGQNRGNEIMHKQTQSKQSRHNEGVALLLFASTNAPHSIAVSVLRHTTDGHAGAHDAADNEPCRAAALVGYWCVGHLYLIAP